MIVTTALGVFTCIRRGSALKPCRARRERLLDGRYRSATGCSLSAPANSQADDSCRASGPTNALPEVAASDSARQAASDSCSLLCYEAQLCQVEDVQE